MLLLLGTEPNGSQITVQCNVARDCPSLSWLRCGQLQADKARWESRTDAFGRGKYAKVLADLEQHNSEQLGERYYADDIWFKAEHHPTRVTAFNMDAPTETQFDVPVQNRVARDVVKSLEGAPRWSSKIMGLLLAGHGMRAYVARAALGGGPNLSLTVLYLGLIALVESGRPLGTVFNVLLDNTGEANKNNEMMFFLAWLVAMDYFEESSFFCMIKGHTYSKIDQTFRALIGQIKTVCIWTVESLVHFIFKFIQAYNCLGVTELPHVWDWTDYFKPHVHERFTGFATGVRHT